MPSDLNGATAAVLRMPVPSLIAQMLNDSGNAERLVEHVGDEIRYCHAFKKWLVWDSSRWQIDATDQVCRKAKDTMISFLEQAMDQRSEAAERFARQSLDARRIKAMLSLAECERVVTPDKLDQDPFLLNFENGTVDLRTGILRPHNRKDFIAKLVHHQYRQDATCPNFLGMLDRITGGGPSSPDAGLDRAKRLVSYLQKALGYSLTGRTSEKVIFLCYGSGNNGKTTLLATFNRLVGEYAALVLIDSIMARQESNNAQADLADLRGARFVMTSETEEGQRLAEGKLKRITQGVVGGKIKAVRKYENPIEFDETHKLWIDANHKPLLRGTDDAIWNRLHPIPFTVTIPSHEIDRELATKLMSEAEGILAWAVSGAGRWYREGLGKPPEIAEAAREYREEMDQLGRFFLDCCEVRTGATVRARELYTAYRTWADGAGERSVSETAFGLKLREREFSKRQTPKGVMYEGIGISPHEGS